MGDPLAPIKQRVREMRPYTLTPRPFIHKLNQNENAYGFPADLKERVLARLRDENWARYPPFDPTELTEAIAARHGIAQEQVLVGNGSNELIYHTMAVTLGEGRDVVIPSPTFSVYRLIATVLGATLHEPRMDAATGFDLPVDEILRRVSANGAQMVVLCSPNNPTGRAYDLAEVREICAASGAIVMLDQAYVEYGGADGLSLIESFPNLVILRTFSKALAMGGLRVGYAITSRALAREIGKGSLPYALNRFSTAAAVIALQHLERFAPMIEEARAERVRLSRALATLPFLTPLPSDANFFLVRLQGVTPQQIFDHLLADGILVRDVSGYPELSGMLRFSVGTPAANDALVESLIKLV